MNEKKCSTCQEIKPLTEFHKDKNHSSKHKSACKVCSSKRFQAWRYSDIDAVRKWERVKQYKRKYKISLDEAKRLVEDRTRVCEICKELKPIIIDHCHETDVVRGFICSACNSVLGYSKDNIETLKSAIAYLEKFYGPV
jgi:ribosomal protein S18